MRLNFINKLLIIIPVIDVLVGIVALKLNLYTGYSMSAKIVTLMPSMLTRLILLIYILQILKISEIIIIMTLVFLMVVSEGYSSILHNLNFSNVFISLVHIVKITTFLVFSVCTINRNVRNKINAHLALTSTLIIYTLAIVLGYLSGSYYTTYGNLGSSGWLIKGSANSLGIVFLLSALPTYNYLILNYGRVLTITAYPLFFFSSMLLLTKASIISIIISTYISITSMLKKKIIKVLIFISSAIMVAKVGMDALINTNIYNRLSYVYDYYDGNILKILLSGRDAHISAGFEIFQEFNIFQILFGYGHQAFRIKMSTYIGKVIGVESDYVDIFLMNGVVILAVYLSLLLINYKLLLIHKVKATYMAIYTLSLLLAGMSGHVLFSGLAGHLIPLYIIYCIQNKSIRSAQ